MVQKVRREKPKLKQKHQTKSGLSKFIHKKPKHQKTKRENTFVFQGFYEKLKKIDVKHSHSLEANNKYDRLMESNDMNEDETFKSNFIQLLRNEKMDNKTIEFGKFFKEVEGYCFSYPLLVHNKEKVINKLLSQLKQQHLKVIQGCILDLLIALIKDFRQDIYQEFMKQIMPQVIEQVDVENVELLDKIFTMISFAIKYLLKPIKENIEEFYDIYFEILTNKNKHIRKFASQSFSYVVRNFKEFNDDLSTMILKPIFQLTEQNQVDFSITKFDRFNKSDMNTIYGVSELFFEVICGASQNLHSRTEEILNRILSKINQNDSKNFEGYQLFIRCLFLQLFYEIDLDKQMELFQILKVNLLNTNNNKQQEQNKSLNEIKITLILTIFNDLITIEYGRRLSLKGIYFIIEVINTIIVQFQEISYDCKLKIASTLGFLYYFKHYEVIQFYSQNQQEFSSNSSKESLFTYGIFQLTKKEEEILQILSEYYQLFFKKSEDISTDKDFKWAYKILEIKHNPQYQMEFSKESHIQKLKLLLKSLSIFTLNKLQNKDVSLNFKIEILSLFEILISQSQEKYNIKITQDLEDQFIILFNSQSDIYDQYVLNKFLTLTSFKNNSEKLNKQIQNQFQKIKQKKQKQQTLNLTNEIQKNYVLKNYALNQDDIKQLEQTCLSLFDLVNIGDQESIQKKSFSFLCNYLSSYQENDQYQIQFIQFVSQNTSDIVILKSFNSSKISNLDIKQNEQLFSNLSLNLQKNSKDLRLETLSILSNKFNILSFLNKREKQIINNNIDQQNNNNDDDQQQMQDKLPFYDGECNILSLLYDFEKLEIGFNTEKNKVITIKKLQSYIESQLIPNEYLNAIYYFLIGCLWVKFTPIHDPTVQALSEIYTLNSGKYTKITLNLMENLNYITQIGFQQEEISQILQNNLDLKPFKQSQQNLKNNLKSQFYQLENNLINTDFMELKDVFYNIIRSFKIHIKNIFSNANNRDKFMNQFYQFINTEYAPIFFNTIPMLQNEESLINKLTYANMVDTAQYKKYRMIAFSKLCCYLDLFTNLDSFKSIPQIDQFQSLMLKLIKLSDTKLQKQALECLIKSNYKQGILKQYHKLLLGFTDDEKFKDTIQILIFGSIEDGSYQLQNDLNEEQNNQKKKSQKNIQNKLAQEHRQDVLPIVIKILMTKLAKKKGAINKKSIQIRRNIIYQFFAGLDPKSEFKLFLNELLENLNLSLNDHSLIFNDEILQSKLIQVSFSNYLNFINQLEVIIKQMGKSLSQFLPELGLIIIKILSLSKVFIKNMKLSLNEDQNDNNNLNIKDDNNNKDDLTESENNDDDDNDNNFQQKQNIYEFVGSQSKICFRKGLGVVKTMFQNYSGFKEFIDNFSNNVYKELVEDELPNLITNVIQIIIYKFILVYISRQIIIVRNINSGLVIK